MDNILQTELNKWKNEMNNDLPGYKKGMIVTEFVGRTKNQTYRAKPQL